MPKSALEPLRIGPGWPRPPLSAEASPVALARPAYQEGQMPATQSWWNSAAWQDVMRRLQLPMGGPGRVPRREFTSIEMDEILEQARRMRLGAAAQRMFQEQQAMRTAMPWAFGGWPA